MPGGGAQPAFDGAGPNGAYSLYVFDDTSNDAGKVAGGFSLDIKTTADGDTTTPGDPTPLYPDLKTLKPTDLRFATATIDGSTHQVLRFTNSVWDAARGR